MTKKNGASVGDKLASLPVATLLCKEPSSALRFSADAYQAGISTVGDLVEMGSETVFKKVKAGPFTKASVKRALKDYGVDFPR